MPDLQEEARAFMRAALAKTGLAPYALAKKAGVAPTTITRPLNDPDFKFVPKAATLGKIAAAADMTLPDTFSAVTPEVVPVTRRIPLVGEVRAGAWAEILDDPVIEEWLPIHLPEYDRAELFALRVAGRSMDLIYADGTIIIVVPAVEAGVRVGDHVVVRRRRGGFAETTLKEVVQESDGTISLHPRSTDPQFQEPIRVDRARDADDGPEIVAVVVATYSVRRSGTGPLVMLD